MYMSLCIFVWTALSLSVLLSSYCHLDTNWSHLGRILNWGITSIRFVCGTFSGSLIDIGGLSPLWVVPFPRHGRLNCVQESGETEQSTSKQASTHFSLLLSVGCCKPAVWGSCLAFHTLMDCNLKLQDEINPLFSSQFFSFKVTARDMKVVWPAIRKALTSLL